MRPVGLSQGVGRSSLCRRPGERLAASVVSLLLEFAGKSAATPVGNAFEKIRGELLELKQQP
jgi:hypothetical protein